jgi:uncharacterized protein (DUF2384 family)
LPLALARCVRNRTNESPQFKRNVLDELNLALALELRACAEQVAPQQHEEIRKVLKHAADTFGSAVKAERWLRRPLAIVGSAPLNLLVSEPKAIDDELTRIDHGIYA